jgi:hypothetical protein
MKRGPDIDHATIEPAPAKRRRGAQPGNRLALKHGRYGGEFTAFKARVRTLVRDVNATLAQLKAARRAKAAGAVTRNPEYDGRITVPALEPQRPETLVREDPS